MYSYCCDVSILFSNLLNYIKMTNQLGLSNCIFMFVSFLLHKREKN